MTQTWVTHVGFWAVSLTPAYPKTESIWAAATQIVKPTSLVMISVNSGCSSKVTDELLGSETTMTSDKEFRPVVTAIMRLVVALHVWLLGF